MDTDKYLKDGVDRVLEDLRDVFGGYFKRYYNGIPDELAESELPLVAATTSSGEIVAGATGTDNIQEEIVIIIALNHKDFIGGGDNVALADLELRRVVYAQDPTTREYLERTVMYALRRFITLTDYIVNNRITFDFSPVRRSETLFTQEATITLRLERMALVPVRN